MVNSCITRPDAFRHSASGASSSPWSQPSQKCSSKYPTVLMKKGGSRGSDSGLERHYPMGDLCFIASLRSLNLLYRSTIRRQPEKHRLIRVSLCMTCLRMGP